MFRSVITTLALTLALVSTAQADPVVAEGQSTAGGYRFTWGMTWDDATKDLTIEASQLNLSTGQPSNAQCNCGVIVTLANGQDRSFDFYALGLLNAGPTVVRNVNAKSYLQRGGGSGLTFTTSYAPPAG